MLDQSRVHSFSLRKEADQAEEYAARLRRAADLLDPPEKPAKKQASKKPSKAGKGTSVSADTVDRVINRLGTDGDSTAGPLAQKLSLSASAVRAALEQGRKQERVRLVRSDGNAKVYGVMPNVPAS